MSSEDLKRIVHIAILVRNIDETLDVWAELLGSEKPPIVETDKWETSHMMFKGKPSRGRAKISFFVLSNITLEFIEPIGSKTVWSDSLDRSGEGLHHLGFEIGNPEEIPGKLRKLGISVAQNGDFKGGSYFYFDSKAKLGAMVELLHHTTE